jgi:hypothetical protein
MRLCFYIVLFCSFAAAFDNVRRGDMHYKALSLEMAAIFTIFSLISYSIPKLIFAYSIMHLIVQIIIYYMVYNKE